MNRTGTYVAFDGQGTSDPTKSDIHYYNLLKAWKESNDIDFSFVNSHEKTPQVRDTSSVATLKRRLLQRLSGSKNFLLIISEDTNYDRGMLSWEIEQAIDSFKLPIIIAYTEYDKISAPGQLASLWPKALMDRIGKADTHCIHIPFLKGPVMDAISQFSVVGGYYPKGGALGIYSDEAYRTWGIS